MKELTGVTSLFLDFSHIFIELEALASIEMENF